MTGIVWGNSFYRAKIKMQDIIEDYARMNISIVKQNQMASNGPLYIDFENGDHWIARGLSESARGYKCNISYIDVNISEESVRNLILHCVTALPYQGITYYS